jgi:hypothetical protein
MCRAERSTEPLDNVAAQLELLVGLAYPGGIRQ